MADLKKITVQNPYSALLRVLKNNHIPKKQAYEAAQFFLDLNNATGSCTAYEIYLSVCDAYEFVCRDFKGDKNKCFEAAQATSRVIYTRWQDVDLEGDFCW